MNIGILHHPHKPESLPLARKIAAWLDERRVETWLSSTWDEAEVHNRTAKSDLIVVLGGDGSILRAARFAVPHQAPIMGVNMGRVGFLSESTIEGWDEVLCAFLEEKFWIERRLMLRADLVRGEGVQKSFSALNDVVIGGPHARVVRLDLIVDGQPITTYTADSLIAATPTGSTAYSMAAGGPLLPPELRNIVLMPVAPYLSLDRALVLHEEVIARIRIRTHHEAILTVDGQDVVPLLDDDQIVIRKHRHEARFIRVGQRGYFYSRLMKRLGFER